MFSGHQAASNFKVYIFAIIPKICSKFTVISPYILFDNTDGYHYEKENRSL